MRLADSGKIHQRLHDAVGVRQLRAAERGNDRHKIAADHTQQNGDNLHHALAPDVGNHDDGHGHQCQPPAGLGVGNGGAGEVQSDHDDHGAGNDGREIAHNGLGTQHLEKQRQHQIQKARNNDAAQRVGQLQLRVKTLVGRHGGHCGKAAEIGKRGPEKRGNLELRAHMEQQRTETRHQQRGLDAQRQTVALHQNRHQHRGAEHSE